MLSVVSATAGIRHYCNYTTNTVLVTSATSSSTSTAALITENKRDYYGEDLIFRNDTLEMVSIFLDYDKTRFRKRFSRIIKIIKILVCF